MRECRLWSMRPCLGLKSSSSISTGCPYHAIHRHIVSSFSRATAARSRSYRAIVRARRVAPPHGVHPGRRVPAPLRVLAPPRETCTRRCPGPGAARAWRRAPAHDRRLLPSPAIRVTAIEPARAGPAAAAERDGAGAQRRAPEDRYGAVLALLLVLVLFVIVAPPAGWSRAVALAIEGAALMVSIGTSRSRRDVRRRRTLAAGGAALVGVTTVAVGVVPSSVTLTIAGLLAFAIPPALGGGLLRMVSERGVTAQAVAGSLAIYLVIGLAFAWTIGGAARVDPSAYFAQGTSGTDGQRVYFSLTVLTTTGFGDLTVAGSLGRALTVLEMLIGQLYLVTVIGVVVGNFRRRDRP